jgi:catechol 2,3-dioxygenase-like lactoylglutathione lyase family enzyme
MKIKHVDHVGITVNDLAGAKIFFVDLGFAVMGETTVEGEWVGRIIGLKDVKSDVVMLQAPDGQVCIELSKFHQPEAVSNAQPEAINTIGIRHLAFQVEDLDDIMEALGKKGRKLVGEIETYQNSWKLCYIHGPENIIIELAERCQSSRENTVSKDRYQSNTIF